jgi:general secretion pathway protein A
MYLEYYGFNTRPFTLSPDPRFFYLSAVHKRALAYLTYGLEDHKGFITVSGEVGTGKTTLIRTLVKQMQTHRVVADVVNTTMDGLELLETIALDFGIDGANTSKAHLLKALHDFLIQQRKVHKPALLIIDEAQNLSLEALEEIRLLSNLETDSETLLQIILVGQPELRTKLQLRQLRQLAQRISVSYHLSALNQEETHGYVQHRLQVAGGGQTQLFTPEAIASIYQFSQGIPRLINVICDAALLAGYVDEAWQFNAEHIATVICDLGLQEATPEAEAPAISLAPSCQQRDKVVQQFADLCRRMEELYDKYTAQHAELVAKVEKLAWLEEKLTALDACFMRKLTE